MSGLKPLLPGNRNRGYRVSNNTTQPFLVPDKKKGWFSFMKKKTPNVGRAPGRRNFGFNKEIPCKDEEELMNSSEIQMGVIRREYEGLIKEVKDEMDIKILELNKITDKKITELKIKMNEEEVNARQQYDSAVKELKDCKQKEKNQNNNNTRKNKFSKKPPMEVAYVKNLTLKG